MYTCIVFAAPRAIAGVAGVTPRFSARSLPGYCCQVLTYGAWGRQGLEGGGYGLLACEGHAFGMDMRGGHSAGFSSLSNLPRIELQAEIFLQICLPRLDLLPPPFNSPPSCTKLLFFSSFSPSPSTPHWLYFVSNI